MHSARCLRRTLQELCDTVACLGEGRPCPRSSDRHRAEVLHAERASGLRMLLFALGAAGVRYLDIFNNTEFLLLTLISLTQAVIGLLINARTMRRSIDVVT